MGAMRVTFLVCAAANHPNHLIDNGSPLPPALPHPGSTPRWNCRRLSYSYVTESKGQVTTRLVALSVLQWWAVSHWTCR